MGDDLQLAGCKVEETPIFLQHWFEHELYHGNSILTDVDWDLAKAPTAKQ